MPYLAASPWQVRSAIKAQQGLGDSAIVIPPPTTLDPIAPNSVIAGDFAAGLPVPADSGSNGIVGALTNLFSSATATVAPPTSLPAQTAAALANVPSSGPNWLEWALIGGGALILLLALSAGGRRR